MSKIDSVKRGRKVCNMKIKTWSQRKLKKARWKRSLQRAMKRGYIYHGFIKFTDEITSW